MNGYEVRYAVWTDIGDGWELSPILFWSTKDAKRHAYGMSDYYAKEGFKEDAERWKDVKVSVVKFSVQRPVRARKGGRR